MQKEKSDAMIADAAKSIFGYCRARTGSQTDAEDLSQDILLELLRSCGNLRDERAFYGFMWAVAGNVYKQWLRKRGRFTSTELDVHISDGGDSLSDLLEKADDVRLLHRELALLTDRYRRAVVAYYFDGEKVAAIAKSLNTSESMVKFLLFKSRKILKEGFKMERTRGELSFNPGTLKLALIGGEWTNYVDPTIFERNLLAQNILLACYNDRCTAEEISLQLGVAVPYLEGELDQLCKHGLLAQRGGKYETAIVIFTKNFAAEEHAKTSPLQRELAEIIAHFLDAQLSDIKKVGFHAPDDDGLLRWNITQIILEQALLENAGDPDVSGGRGLYIWGEEEAQYGCMTTREKNASGNELRFMEPFGVSFNERIFDFGYFWKQQRRVDLMLEIARGKTDGNGGRSLPAPFDETLEIAEFIRLGWLRKDGGTLRPCIPVYTAAEFSQILSLASSAISAVAEKAREMLAVSTEVLSQHTPAAKKKDAAEIAFLRKHFIAMKRPVEIMRDSGALRRFSEGEHPMTYALLK